ncbi:hypothetical protein P3S67_008276 [Capsicum chacoense]
MSKDSEIPANKLMRSWMAEGFLKLENDLEGEAEKCLQEMVDRCLVLVCKKSVDGTKIRSYSESLLSMQKMQPFKRKIGYCPHGFYRALLKPVYCQLRDHDNNDLSKRTHSIFSFHLQDSYYLILKSELIHFKLLKALELTHIEIDSFPLEILSLIWLRHLSLQCRGCHLDMPPEICRLWNLQTFIVQGLSQSDLITFPEEIWGLMQLRHLKLPEFYLPNPQSVSADKGSHMDFSNIQTISYLSPHCFTKEVIVGIQNVNNLGIYGVDYDGLLNNLVHLQQLETLKAEVKIFFIKLAILGHPLGYACHGNELHPHVRGFARLKLLLIENNDLKHWKATNDNFPLIELRGCPPKLGESAARIQKEQEDLGNNPVDVRISDPSRKK